MVENYKTEGHLTGIPVKCPSVYAISDKLNGVVSS